MSQPVILITGQNGQLGNELKTLSATFPKYDFVFTDAAKMDITKREIVAGFFNKYQPAICINAAAYTAVDKAETERELALKINADAVGFLAENCAAYNTRFLQVSTDYVFDGTASVPYSEDHPVSPVNFYGESKLKGEDAALKKLPSTVIIRTSWVYSFYGNNFVKTMLRLMKERESISVINDQLGSPTYAADLAGAVMRAATTPENHPGIYHFSNDGIISWYDFAVAIRDIAGLQCEVHPIDTSGFPTPAKRPAWSVMDKKKIQAVFDIRLNNWKDSLEKCIKLLQQ